ncbi:MAG: hypothetical protein AVO35_07600 [Candidatus Aegiribacteria sp. MLS_C]|nr:MAG: hypothetical protein AVO35_07600 [Candidatus Aegiribacteria sp. MLS_C]
MSAAEDLPGGPATPTGTEGLAGLERSSRAANSGFMLAGQLLGRGSLFLSIMLLSRYLRGPDFGALLFAVVLGQIYLIFSDMGLSLVINMRTSVRPSDGQDLISVSMTLKTVLALAGLPLLLLSGALMGMTGQRLLLLSLIGVSVLFESYAEMFYSVFRAREKMAYESASRVIMGITGLAAVILMMRFGAGLLAIACAYMFRTLAALAVSSFFVRRMDYRIRFTADTARVRELLSAALPLGIMGLVIVVQQRADNVVLRQMMGENAVAAWQECLRIVEILVLLVIPTLLPGALFPSLCRAFANGSYGKRVGDMSRVFTALAVMSSFVVLSAGDGLMRLVWGSDYLRGIDAGTLQLCLYLSLLGMAAVYLMHIMVNSLLAVNRIRIVVPVNLAALVMVVGGNLLLIPLMGLAAAGALFVAGNLFVLVSYWYFLRTRGYRLPVWKEASITLGVSIPSFTLLMVLRGSGFLPSLVPASALFLVLWWATGGGSAFRRLFPGRVQHD